MEQKKTTKPKTAGKVVLVDKTWLSLEETIGYLGKNKRWIKETLPSLGVRVAFLGQRSIWYNLADINHMLEHNVCNQQQMIAAKRIGII